MSNFKNYVIWVVVTIALTMAFSIVSNNKCKSETPTGPLRFKELETIVFRVRHGEIQRATIYLDKKTGIKYMCTGGDGPAITRLWEKEEKK